MEASRGFKGEERHILAFISSCAVVWRTDRGDKVGSSETSWEALEMTQVITVFVHSLNSCLLCIYCVPGTITGRLRGHCSCRPSGPFPQAVQETQESVRRLLLCGLPHAQGQSGQELPFKALAGCQAWGGVRLQCSQAWHDVAVTGILAPRFPPSTMSPMLQPPQVTPGSSKSGST